jgi:deoxyribodipyrimidine photolyase-related protein
MAPSLLSVPLTLGLLHPLDVVRAGEDAHRAGAMPIASAEGFVRQVLGWRDYVRQLYWRFGRSYLRRNALRVRTPLPDWRRSLDADAVTAQYLRTALEGNRGWTHHISGSWSSATTPCSAATGPRSSPIGSARRSSSASSGSCRPP